MTPAPTDLPALFVAGDLDRSFQDLPYRPWEVGGWLLGYWSADRQAIVVASATPPAGRGTAFGVTIDAKGHRKKFDEAWEATGGTITFLGDWHTHPGGTAAPSTTDRRAMDQLAGDPAYGTALPVIAIVAIPSPLPPGRAREIAYVIRTEDGRAHRLRREIAAAGLPVDALPSWNWPRRH